MIKLADETAEGDCTPSDLVFRKQRSGDPGIPTSCFIKFHWLNKHPRNISVP